MTTRDPTTDQTPDPLARQLLEQAQQIARLRRDLHDLAHQATDTIANLLDRINDLETQHPTTGGTPTAWCWRDLGPNASQELWHQLTDWVDWIRARYPLARKIPPCWNAHPETVEELTALWLAWQAAYQDPNAPLTAAADWHDRWLPGTLNRFEHGVFALDCTNGHHPRPAAAYTTPEPSTA